MGTSYGKDDPVISSLIKNRCYTHLRMVFSEIRKQGKHPWERIEPTMSSESKLRLVYLRMYRFKIYIKITNNY